MDNLSESEKAENEQTMQMVYQGIVRSRNGENFKRSFGDSVYLYLCEKAKKVSCDEKNKVMKQANDLKKYMEKVKYLLLNHKNLTYEKSRSYKLNKEEDRKINLPYKD